MIRKITKNDTLLIPIIDVKGHLRVDSSFDDSQIYQMLRAAQEYVERFTSRAIVSNTYEFTFSDDPVRQSIGELNSCELPDRLTLRVGDISEIVSINTYDQAAAATSIDITGYDIINFDQFTEIIRKNGQDVPRGTRSYRDLIILFKAGYTEATLPFSLRQGILEVVNFFYECRDGLADGSVMEPDHTIRAKLIKFKLECI